jgi:hypothetical protein
MGWPWQRLAKSKMVKSKHVRKEAFGTCRVCLDDKQLTFEHVLPKGAFMIDRFFSPTSIVFSEPAAGA